MPNEQTSVPLFAASEILTAANMNISAGTGVPVFATTATRNAAFGGANEKLLAEGQMCYLSDTNVVQYYSGTAWVSLGERGLTFLSSTTANATSISLPANTFSSAFTNYKVIFQGTASGGTSTVSLRFKTAGVDNATANYNYASVGLTYAGAAFNANGAAQTSIALQTTTVALPAVYAFDVIGPNTATNTQILGAATANNATPVGGAFNINANFAAATVFDSLSFIFVTSQTQTVTVYGYNI